VWQTKPAHNVNAGRYPSRLPAALEAADEIDLRPMVSCTQRLSLTRQTLNPLLPQQDRRK
jgi:hypothetical protein